MNLEQLGKALNLVVHGDPQHIVQCLAPIDTASSADLSFVVSKRYKDALKKSQAGAVIMPEAMLADAPGNALLSDNPYASYAQASWLLYPPAERIDGIHPTAIVHADASVSESASIGPYVVIGAGSRIADNVIIDAHCFVGENVVIGNYTRLFARVNIYSRVSIGQHCRIQSGAIIGAEGFGYAWQTDSWVQINQIGGVQIADHVHVGANTTIDCGAIEPTVIETGVILDNQIQIAHNVRIGENTAIAGCVGIAGSTCIGRHCQIGGSANIVGHLDIADGVIINAASLVTRSITDKGRYGSGAPLQQERAWRRSFVNLGKLDELFRRVRRIEHRLVKTSKADDKTKAQ